ncbi:MAG: MFS transporter [Clostridia bacterium]|nr:MFS transporter [Clostridia bacterium]
MSTISEEHDERSVRLDRADIRHNIRINKAHGAWQSLALNLFNPFLGVIAIRMGGTNAQVALITALPAAVSFAVGMPGAAFLSRFPRKKRAACALYFASRLFLLGVAALPLITSDRRAGALVALIALMNIPGAVANTAWQSLIADSIPEEHRGEAFAARSRLVTAVGFLPAMLGGYILDAAAFPIGYQAVFVAAFAVSMAEIHVLRQIREPVMDGLCSGKGAQVPQTALSRVLANRDFRGFTLRTMLFYLGWLMGQPLFTIFYVRVLRCGNFWVGVFSVVSGMAQFVSFPVWSVYAAKKGNAAALAAATVGMALTPVMIGMSRHPWVVAVFSVSMGIFTSGTTLLLLNSLLELAPAEGRTKYIAYYNTCINLASFIGPLVGQALVRSLDIYWALGICALIRAAGSIAIWSFARRRDSERAPSCMRRDIS